MMGRVSEEEGLFRSIADTSELTRELGAIELAKNMRQTRNGEELAGGLVTKDFRIDGGETSKTVEVLASYKFAPKISLLEANDPNVFWFDPDTSFGSLLAQMDFEYTIATRDAHLKSVLYLSSWPTPNDR